MLTTLPEVGEPCKLEDNDCKKLPNVALLPLMPSADIKLLKLCCSAAKLELLEPELDELVLEPLVPLELVEEPSSEIRF